MKQIAAGRASIWLGGCMLGLPLVAACSAFGGGVTRVVDGQVQEGPFIGPDAYAAYARGALLEAQEQYPEAEQAYTEALELDPNSVGVWTRLGSVRCAGGRPDAAGAFERAERLEPAFAALWYERGRCSLRRNEPRRANEAALRALSLDPLHLPTTTLVVETFVQLKQTQSALRYLDAAIALYPHVSALTHWKHAILEGRGAADAARAASRPKLEEVDRALLNDTSDAARELALALDLAESELAARAVALGKTKAGRKQAQHVQQADPADGTAWVTLLSSADLLRDEVLYEATLNALDEEPTAPSSLAVVLLGELLKRRVGSDAARAWLDAAVAGVPENPLVARQLRRLENELENAASAAVPKAETPPP